MPVYNKMGILLLPKVIVLNPKDGTLAMDVQMRIGLVKKKNILFSRYADTYIEALKKYVSIG